MINLDEPSFLWQKGELEETLRNLERIESSQEFSTIDRFTIKLFKVNVLVSLKNFDKALILADESVKEARDLNDDQLVLDALLTRLNALIYLKKFEKASELIKHVDSVLKSIKKIDEEDKILKQGTLSVLKGNLYQEMFDLLAAREWFTQALDCFERIGYEWGILIVLRLMSLINYRLGTSKAGLEYAKRGLRLSKKVGNNIALGHLYIDLANNFSSLGEINQAICYYLEAKALAEKIQNNSILLRTLMNLGSLYTEVGKPRKARLILLEGRELSEKLQDEEQLAYFLRNLGFLHEALGELNKAKDLYLESLSLYKKLNDTYGIASAIYFLFVNAVERESIKEAQTYFEQITAFAVQAEGAGRRAEKFMKALLLKASSRPKDKFEAQKLFEEIVEDQSFSFVDTILIPSMIHLYELLLYELRISGDSAVLKVIKVLTQKINQFAKDQEISSLKAEVLLIKSQLALLEKNLEQSQELLTEAQKFAREKGLTLIEQKANSLKNQLVKWKKIIEIEKNISIAEIIKLTQFEDLLWRIARKKALITEEETRDYAEEAQRKVKTWEEEEFEQEADNKDDA
ncbi:MAG: tetratricopeptide repeat protein [Promethearchaeota archaeon]